MKINVKYNLQNPNLKKTIIMISITWEGNRVQLSSGMSIGPKSWNKTKQVVKPNYTNAFEINRYLEKLSNDIKNFYFELKARHELVSKKMIKEKFYEIILPEHQGNDRNSSLIDQFDQYIQQRIASKKYSDRTNEKFKICLNHLKRYQAYSRTILTFDNMNKEFAEKFLYYLIEKKNLINSSAGTELKHLKTFLRFCLDNQITDNAKFVRDFTLASKEIRTNKESDLIALTENELKQIESFESPVTKIMVTKDLFLIQIYTGLRISDLMNLKPENFDLTEGMIRIYTIKTEDPLIIPIHSRIIKILNNYPDLILPVFEKKNYNKLIKELCKGAGIVSPVQVTKYYLNRRVDETKAKYEVITSHTARRTFITLSLKMGLLPEMVMKISGHKDRKSFQKYVRIAQNEAVEAVKNAWDK